MEQSSFAEKEFRYYSSTESLQSPLTPKGGVVVKSGDKCVAPAKSKPKKRICVGDGLDSPQGLDHVEWSQESFAVDELSAMFKDRYPIMLRVTQGYSGKSGVEYAADMVLQVHSSAFQKRVLAIDALNRVISIPVDYPANVQVLEKKTNRVPCSLHDVLRTTSMPFTGRVTGWVNEGKTRPGLDVIHLELKFIKVIESPFLLGNAIIDGWIDQMEIIVIPSILGLEFSVGLGLRGAGDEEWKEYKCMFERTIRHLKFENVRGFKEAVEVPYTQDINMNNNQHEAGNKVYENLQNNVPMSSANQQRDHIYENLKGKKSTGGSSNYETRHSTFSTTTNCSEANITQMFDSVLKTAENEERKLIQKSKPSVAVPTAVPTSQSVKDIAKRMERSAETPKAVVSPTVQEPKGPPQHVTSVNVRNEEGIKYRKPSKNQNKDARSTLDVSVVGEEEKRKYEAVAKLRPLSKEYVLSGTGIQNVDDIPDELYDLTVEDVCACLQLLNMADHSSDFRKKQVDGGLLMGLDENVLQKEFHFSPFNASKLLRFTRGWRPKFV